MRTPAPRSHTARTPVAGSWIQPHIVSPWRMYATISAKSGRPRVKLRVPSTGIDEPDLLGTRHGGEDRGVLGVGFLADDVAVRGGLAQALGQPGLDVEIGLGDELAALLVHDLVLGKVPPARHDEAFGRLTDECADTVDVGVMGRRRRDGG